MHTVPLPQFRWHTTCWTAAEQLCMIPDPPPSHCGCSYQLDSQIGARMTITGLQGTSFLQVKLGSFWIVMMVYCQQTKGITTEILMALLLQPYPTASRLLTEWEWHHWRAHWYNSYFLMYTAYGEPPLFMPLFSADGCAPPASPQCGTGMVSSFRTPQNRTQIDTFRGNSHFSLSEMYVPSLRIKRGPNTSS